MKQLTIDQARTVAQAAALISDLPAKMAGHPLAALGVFAHADAINAAMEALGYATASDLDALPVHEWIDAVAECTSKALIEYAPYLGQKINPAIGRQAKALNEMLGGIANG